MSLGHCQLDWGQTLQHRCRRNDLRAFDSRQLEKQRANQFAVELLMPYPIFQAGATNLPEVGLPAIDTLAARYSTSLTSTAIRYTRLSQHICAIVSTENGRVKYFAYSEKGFAKTATVISPKTNHFTLILSHTIFLKVDPRRSRRSAIFVLM